MNDVYTVFGWLGMFIMFFVHFKSLWLDERFGISRSFFISLMGSTGCLFWAIHYYPDTGLWKLLAFYVLIMSVVLTDISVNKVFSARTENHPGLSAIFDKLANPDSSAFEKGVCGISLAQSAAVILFLAFSLFLDK
ncbi:MAG: hypothetical protein EP312_00775 [Gammaproteobacteria bacterium]|nr:MAG: hypothetical protein EP312_00775 [Gammaproteobacteria bacterium]